VIGIVDEVGHLATAAILVAAWPVRLGRPLVLVALVSSVAGTSRRGPAFRRCGR
jgi:hypothetical protein